MDVVVVAAGPADNTGTGFAGFGVLEDQVKVGHREAFLVGVFIQDFLQVPVHKDELDALGVQQRPDQLPRLFNVKAELVGLDEVIAALLVVHEVAQVHIAAGLMGLVKNETSFKYNQKD